MTRGSARDGIRGAAAVGAGLAPARPARPIEPGERIHVVGAAGAGASAAALLGCLGRRERSTAAIPGGASASTRRALVAAGIHVADRHDPAHVRAAPRPAPARLAVTKALTAIDPDNPELAAARAAGIPLEAWQQVVADAAARRTLVAVAGTHGKSTTSGWLVGVLAAGGADPGAFVGALLPASADRDRRSRRPRAGAPGAPFVVEADEYAGNFDPYRPAVAVLTSAEWDHPDVFADRAAVLAAFEAWIRPMAGRRRAGRRRHAAGARRERGRRGRRGAGGAPRRLAGPDRGDRARRRRAAARRDVRAGHRGPVPDGGRPGDGAPGPDHRPRTRDATTLDIAGARSARRPGHGAPADGGPPQRRERARRRGRGRGRGPGRRTPSWRGSRGSAASGGGSSARARRRASSCTTTTATTRRRSARRWPRSASASPAAGLGGVRAADLPPDRGAARRVRRRARGRRRRRDRGHLGRSRPGHDDRVGDRPRGGRRAASPADPRRGAGLAWRRPRRWLAGEVRPGDVVLVMGGGRSYRIGELLLEHLEAG